MFELLFKYSRGRFDSGELVFASGWSSALLWLAVLLAALLLGASLWLYRREIGSAKSCLLWLLQLAVVILLLLMLWQPALKLETVKPGENTLAVVLDTSASMDFEDEGHSRRGNAVELLQKQIAPALGDTFNLDYYSLGEQLSSLKNLDNLPAPAARSNLSALLTELLAQTRATPLAGVILASDGNETGSESAAGDLAQLREQLALATIPIHTIGFGDETLRNDVQIENVAINPRTLPGSIERATVTLRHSDNERARIRVFAGSQLVAVDEVRLNGNQTTRSIDLPADQPGLQELRFEVEGDQSDQLDGNNRQRRLLQVSQTPRRVLYFEGDPRWEYKFIRRALADSSGIALVSLLRTTPNKFYRQGIEDASELEFGFPETREALYRYDAVIVGNVESVSLNSQQQQILHDYVAERGGSLLMLAGNRALGDGGWQNSPLARVLPVQLDTQSGRQTTFERIRARAELTDYGSDAAITRLHDDVQQNRQMWSEMPELGDFQATGPLKAGARALLQVTRNAESLPLLASQRYGKGHSYVLASSGTWRWQMQLPHDDLRHETFWRQLIGALASTAPQRLDIKLADSVFRDQQTVNIVANALDQDFQPALGASLSASATAPDGEQQDITLRESSATPGRYEATLEAPQTGSWRVDIAAQYTDQTESSTTRWFAREDGTAELFALRQDRSFLKQLARESGGQYWATDDTQGLPDALRNQSAGVTRLQFLSLWNAPIFFLLLLGFKLLEWLLRLGWKRL